MQIDKSMQLTTYHHTSCLSLHLYIQVQFMYACFCPTSLCGVLVFGSVYPVRLLASSFRARCVTQLCHTPSFTYTTLPGDIHLRFAWQAWHFQTSPHSVCVAGVTLVALGWLWWRAWAPLVTGDAAAGVALPDIHTLCAWHGTCGTGLAPVARLGAAGRRWRRGTLHGRRSTWWHPCFSCVAGVALGDIHAVVASRARHFQISTFSLRGRRGAWRHPPSLGMAGVALGDIDLRLAWQGGTYGTGLGLVARLVAVSRPWRRGTLRGRRGAWRHRPSFWRGRRGFWRHPPSFCVAVVSVGTKQRAMCSGCVKWTAL